MQIKCSFAFDRIGRVAFLCNVISVVANDLCGLYKSIRVHVPYRKSSTSATQWIYWIFRMPADQIQYSEKYFDDNFEYRHVILPPDLAKHVPKAHLMTETEWRNLGVQQSPGWVHYMVHAPEPHVILFRRKRISAEDAPQVAAANAAQAIANLCG
uniref:Cyclin-dependent kinases regulatory subunit n=2 Tax=Drosophila rhopaloa TaxID=1041015 RepID=A0A6P4EQU6_DRORH